MLLRTSTPLTKVFLAVLVIVAAYKSQAQVFDFEQSHPKSVSLEGPLRFHLGDDSDGKLGWADPAFDDSQWTLLISSQTWSEQGYKDYSGFAWYRLKVIVPAYSDHLGILIPQLRTSYEIFADGKFIGQFGGIPPHGRYVIGFDQIFPLPTDSSSAGHPIVVAIRVWNLDWLARNGGGPEGAPTIGEMDALKSSRTQNDWGRFWSITAGNALMLMNLVAGFAGFFLFWMRPADREYLWFALYELLTGVQHLCTDWVMFYPTDWKTVWLLEDLPGYCKLAFLSCLLIQDSEWSKKRVLLGCSGDGSRYYGGYRGFSCGVDQLEPMADWSAGLPDSVFCMHSVPSLPESTSGCRGCPIDVCTSCRLLFNMVYHFCIGHLVRTRSNLGRP